MAMTRQAPRESSEGRKRAMRGAALPPAAMPSAPRQRRWGRVLAGAVVVLLSGVVIAGLFQSAGDRVEVLALANDVAEHETIDGDDLSVVRVSVDPDVETIPAGDLESIVGGLASTDLVAGGLLSPGHVATADERVVGEGESVVGLLLSAGDGPLAQLTSGASVDVVVRPASGTAGEASVVEGWLLDASGDPQANGDQPVSVVIPSLDVGEVSAAAAEDRVTIGLRED